MTTHLSLKELLDWCRDKGQILFGEKKLNHLWNFLLGYNFARKEMGIEASREQEELTEFDKWLHEKYRGHYAKCWATLLEEKHGDKAWEVFYNLLDEYRSTRI